MKKKECIHLHALLAMLLKATEKREDVPAATLDDYPDGYVSPSDVHRVKRHHVAAMRTLARALAEELPEHGAEPPGAQ